MWHNIQACLDLCILTSLQMVKPCKAMKVTLQVHSWRYVQDYHRNHHSFGSVTCYWSFLPQTMLLSCCCCCCCCCWLNQASQHLSAINLHPCPKIKGHVLGICALYGTFLIVLHFTSLLRCFWLDLYTVDILRDFGEHFFHWVDLGISKYIVKLPHFQGQIFIFVVFSA